MIQTMYGMENFKTILYSIFQSTELYFRQSGTLSLKLIFETVFMVITVHQ